MARKNDAFYFEAFCASADYSYQAAQLLSKIMHNFDPDRWKRRSMRCTLSSRRPTSGATRCSTRW